jgi:hypothetical protein
MDDGKSVVCMLLGVSLLASLFICWLLLFRLPDHLTSVSYRFILAAKVCFALLSGSGIYLLLWPLKVRPVWIQLAWFSVLSIGTCCSAVGFWLYSRDVQAVLQSDDYVQALPADPTPHPAPAQEESTSR